MIQITKRCLKKTIGNAHLTYDELLTSVTEVRGVTGDEDTANSMQGDEQGHARSVAGDTEIDAPIPDCSLRPSSTSVSAEPSQQTNSMPRRQAFLRAQKTKKAWIDDMNMD